MRRALRGLLLLSLQAGGVLASHPWAMESAPWCRMANGDSQAEMGQVSTSRLGARPILGALPPVPGFASQLVALVLVPVTLRGFLVESWVVQDVSP